MNPSEHSGQYILNLFSYTFSFFNTGTTGTITEYTLMIVLVIKYLGIPATSISSEQYFSTFRNKVTAKRNLWSSIQ